MDFLGYSERMLQIGDYVPSHEQANSGRTINKVRWQEQALQAIWRESANTEDFAKRAAISVARASALDEHFRRIFGLGLTPKKKRKKNLERSIEKMMAE